MNIIHRRASYPSTFGSSPEFGINAKSCAHLQVAVPQDFVQSGPRRTVATMEEWFQASPGTDASLPACWNHWTGLFVKIARQSGMLRGSKTRSPGLKPRRRVVTTLRVSGAHTHRPPSTGSVSMSPTPIQPRGICLIPVQKRQHLLTTGIQRCGSPRFPMFHVNMTLFSV